ncbi:MAG: hypothetical protein AUI16_21455 [Alphaproteobacteria bacterium 13_2_20CM_2_64_7]|nr:MAG: hypothetical protein AUI16_21455 [Alphaproteobacteria bacterium 13_2_20CM_2_64_7]
MLQDAGFSPIPVMGKKPVIEDWPNKLDVSREEIFSWEIEFPDVNNTGILTQNTPTFDCDILSPVAAAAVEKLLRERFGKTGRILKRTGMAPKFAIPFRTDTAFAKIQVKLLPASAGDDADPEQLEFLGAGQQLVAFGLHPDTSGKGQRERRRRRQKRRRPLGATSKGTLIGPSRLETSSKAPRCTIPFVTSPPA